MVAPFLFLPIDPASLIFRIALAIYVSNTIIKATNYLASANELCENLFAKRIVPFAKYAN